MSHLYEIPARSRNSRAGFLYTERMRRRCRICGVFSEEKRKQKNAADLQHHLCCTPAALYYPDSSGKFLLCAVILLHTCDSGTAHQISSENQRFLLRPSYLYLSSWFLLCALHFFTSALCVHMLREHFTELFQKISNLS